MCGNASSTNAFIYIQMILKYACVPAVFVQLLNKIWMLQLIGDLHDNTVCAMQADKGRQGSWFQVSTGFKQGDVNAPLFFNVFLDSICRYIESKAGELGLRLTYNIDGHLTGHRRSKGSMPCWILLYADNMVIFEKSRKQMRAVLAVVHQALEDWGMQMSISKTRYLHYGTAQHSDEPLHIAQQEVEQVSKLGIWAACRHQTSLPGLRSATG